MTPRTSIERLADCAPVSHTGWVINYPPRITTDHDEGSPGSPRRGETLQQWSDRARASGYTQYRKTQ